MKKNLIIILSIVLLLNSCNKESASDKSSSTGAGGSTARFTIAGNYLYVVDNTSIKTFDISNAAAAPVLKSTINVGVNVETIFPYQDKLFIGSSFAMHIYSLSNPEKPTKLAQAEYIVVRMSCDPVVAKDSTAYATLNAAGGCGGGLSQLVVYNIKDISKPVLKATIPLFHPLGLGISDSALYVCDGTGLNVFNIRNTYSPQFLRTITGETFFDVIPYGNILICQVSNGIALYDISTRYQPVFLSKVLN